MKVLVTGNMGYVGPSVIDRLRADYADGVLLGFDIGYFGACVTGAAVLPETKADAQYFGDVRRFEPSHLEEVDAVVHLAGISNDPMGNRFEQVTLDINHRSSVNLAQLAKKAGAKSFVFASSCSIYGAADDGPRTEESAVNPLTAYARSKVLAEQDLRLLADKGFTVTSLRFSTACGWSDRLRLDLVLNDFVAGAVASKQIMILSDGTPWRPLIDVRDMARAVSWAVRRRGSDGGDFLAINVGSDGSNYQVRDLAYAVAAGIPGVEVSINRNAAPDRRSYRVNFRLFRELAPENQPMIGLKESINELKNGLEAIGFKDEDFRNSKFMRLKVLTQLQQRGRLDEQLRWIRKS
jgi:nucleoside-diphosphate-sugar epimerase